MDEASQVLCGASCCHDAPRPAGRRCDAPRRGRETDRGGLQGRLRGGRRCRDAPRPAGRRCDAPRRGRETTAAECEAGSAVAGSAVTLPAVAPLDQTKCCGPGGDSAREAILFVLEKEQAERPHITIVRHGLVISTGSGSIRSEASLRSAWCGISLWREKTLFRRYL